jgi:hypothetical protein
MAGARVEKKLTAVRVKALREAGKSEDDGGLWLVAEPSTCQPSDRITRTDRQNHKRFH